MIAKLITYGKTRSEAIDLMKKALSDYRVKF
jgi:acetyl/propionyl-CoA carboxylase alpha subunit